MRMSDVVAVCDSLGTFRYEAGPLGVLLPAPIVGGYRTRPDRRIRSCSGIGRAGQWRLVDLPSGEPRSEIVSTRVALRRALLWQFALDEGELLLPPRAGHTIHAKFNRTRLGAGYIFVYRKAPDNRHGQPTTRTRR